MEVKDKIVTVEDLGEAVKYLRENDLEDLKKSVSDGKTKLAAAITEKGVETASDATFDTMAENVGNISGSTSGNDNLIVNTNRSEVVKGNDIVKSEIKDAECLYIESAENQYIDTQVIPTSNTKIIIDIEPLGDSNGYLLGQMVSDTSNTYRFFNSYGVMYFDLDGRIMGGSLRNGDRAIIELGNYYIKKNGEIITSSSTKEKKSSDLSIYLFGGNENGTPMMSKQRLYSCKIYEGDTLIRDFIPKEDTDGVACLYDNVTKQYFYNQGTGNFIVRY